MNPLSRTPAPASTPPPPRWLLPLLWTCFAACVAAMAATFAWPAPGRALAPSAPGDAGDRDLVEAATLPGAAAPAATFDPASDWRHHPDLPQLASGDAALLRDLGFHAWHAARIAASPYPAGPGPASGPDPLVPDAMDPDALDPAQRDALRQRVAAWDALAPAERSARRERWQAWRQLPAAERDAVRDAAAIFAALPPERQQELRREFDRLPPDDRRGWLLGPRLGAAWPRLQPLLMQVPDAQREPLLAMLHRLSPPQLDDLAILAQRTPPQARAALRSGLLATPEAARADWLRERLRR